MSDHCEEQEMEAEALTAIFEDDMEVLHDQQPFRWAVSLWPEAHGEDENHIGIRLVATIPLDYPEVSLPQLEISILKGLSPDHRDELLAMAQEEAVANQGMPAIYVICERLREWLAENNAKGMDDVSMYAQMMRREKEAEKASIKAQQEFEAQKQKEELTQTEAEELAIRKRRAEGTPVVKETFEAWRERFNAEMAALAEQQANEAVSDKGRKQMQQQQKKVVDKSGRKSGYEQFSDKAGTFNLEAIEAACEEAQVDEEEEEEEEEDLDNVNEELFDLEDDDLDDLDFDDDDEDEEEEEPDI